MTTFTRRDVTRWIVMVVGTYLLTPVVLTVTALVVHAVLSWPNNWSDLAWAILLGWAASAALAATLMALIVRLHGRREWFAAAVATAAFAVAPAMPSLVRFVEGAA